jgi:predicted AlkP superfamily pyrophosphatase or phosphodiesterase
MLSLRSRIRIVLLFIYLVLASLPAAPAQVSRKPKLVVLVVVDQFRYDYTTRFRSEYRAGLERMLKDGAVFTNANYQQVPTVTAVGHSVISSGAMPAISGIAGNGWFERETGRTVKSVCDYDVAIVGAKPQLHDLRTCEDYDPASPKRLLVSTIGDELRAADPKAKVIGMSLKARSAILPSGRTAQGAFWFDDTAGAFVSSTYYFHNAKLPDWVNGFNNRKKGDSNVRLIDSYVETKWPSFPLWDFHGDRNPYDRIAVSPWGNELLEDFAESAIQNEKLGQRDSTDLLTVSFSSNDYIGHITGPDAPEVEDMCVRTDMLLGKLMTFVEKTVGAGNALYVLTADHGVAPLPTERQKLNQSGDYFYFDAGDYLNVELRRKYGQAQNDWVLATVDNVIYLNWKTVDEKRLSHSEIQKTGASLLLDAAEKLPAARIARVFTRDELLAGVPNSDTIGQAVTRGFNVERSGDIIWIQEPYFVIPGGGADLGGHEHKGTTHSSPYPYDTHVPMIFYGAGIHAGEYLQSVAPNDIAPTLAAILGVKMPNGSSGNVLKDVFQRAERSASE